MYYPTGRNIWFLICLLCCNVDFSEPSLYLNSTDVNRVLFHTTQKICNLSLFSELGSYLICLYTIGPTSLTKKLILSLNKLSMSISLWSLWTNRPAFLRNTGLLVSYTNYLTPPQTTSTTSLKLHTNLSSNHDTIPVSISVNPPHIPPSPQRHLKISLQSLVFHC